MVRLSALTRASDDDVDSPKTCALPVGEDRSARDLLELVQIEAELGVDIQIVSERLPRRTRQSEKNAERPVKGQVSRTVGHPRDVLFQERRGRTLEPGGFPCSLENRGPESMEELRQIQRGVRRSASVPVDDRHR